jgi:AraC-like DNA-binding protein
VRHLTRAKDMADMRYTEPLGVDDMARVAGLSRAHFSREFRRAFGEPPHAYLLTRRLERAAALLRTTDYSVADVCMAVGLQSVGSFTSSFRRAFGVSPTSYRASFPPASAWAVVPSCVVRVYGRPGTARVPAATATTPAAANAKTAHPEKTASLAGA